MNKKGFHISILVVWWLGWTGSRTAKVRFCGAFLRAFHIGAPSPPRQSAEARSKRKPSTCISLTQ
eukprot:4130426-Amphidinium_carterae.1